MMNIKPVVPITLFFIFLIGCTGTTQVGNDSRIPDLVLYTPAGKEGDLLAQVVKTFEKQEGLAVKTITPSELDFTSQLWSSLLSQSNQWDAVMLPTDMIPQLVDYKGIIPISLRGLLPDAGQDKTGEALVKTIQDVLIDGKTYGLPIQYDVPVLIYRKDILDQQGITPPQDWQSLLSTIEVLKGNSDRHAYVVAPGEGLGGFDFAIYLAGFGGSFLDNDSLVLLDDTHARQAFTFYVRLVRDLNLTSPDVVKWGSEAAINQLRSGNAIMGIVWLSDAASIMDCKRSSQVCTDGKTNFALSQIPGMMDQDGVIKRSYLRKEKAWVIPRNVPHQKAAQSWLDWLASDEGCLAWAKAGGVPFNLWSSSPDGSGGERPDLSFLSGALPESVGMPAIIDQDEFWAPIHEMVMDAASGVKPGDQALADGARSIRAILITEGKIPPLTGENP